jgi:hypothetical protein
MYDSCSVHRSSHNLQMRIGTVQFTCIITCTYFFPSCLLLLPRGHVAAVVHSMSHNSALEIFYKFIHANALHYVPAKQLLWWYDCCFVQAGAVFTTARAAWYTSAWDWIHCNVELPVAISIQYTQTCTTISEYSCCYRLTLQLLLYAGYCARHTGDWRQLLVPSLLGNSSI